MNGRRTAIGAGIGALLGSLWWGIRELIASGTVCSPDDCLGVGVIAMPTATVAGGAAAWLVMRSLHLDHPAPTASIGVVLTVWIPVPSGAIVTGALGFAIGAAVTGTRRVSETAARD